MVEELQADAYDIYRNAQKASGEAAMRKVLDERATSGSRREQVIDEACNMFEELNSFFLSISQSRKSRAGSAFEITLSEGI